ncbi:MAG: HAD family hydrolase [Lachnospiraceae bacterium]|nr:HAD family hydrolase [Lachnospiraceae bacterium]
MEILKSVLLLAALVGVSLLDGTFLEEGCKIIIFVIACIVSYDIFGDGIRGVKNRVITDGLPMVLPLILTGFYGIVYWVRMVINQHKELVNADGLYKTVIIGMFIYRLILVGESIFTRIRKSKSNKYIKAFPKECVKYSGGKGVKVKCSDIVPGDIVILRQGEEITFDGVVLKGESVVYEGITLGKRYVHKNPKDEVRAGSINCDGAMYIKVTGVGKDTVIGNDLKAVRKSVQYKKKVLKSTDTANGMAFILQIVCGVLVMWTYMFKGENLLGLRQATLSTCIMMPIIFYVVRFATDIYSYCFFKNKILINGTVRDVMESAAQINNYIVDYDDVLTTGDEKIIDVYSDQLEEEKILKLCRVAVSKTKGLSYRALKVNNEEAEYTLEGFKEYVGKGIDAAINPGRLIVTVGNKEYMVEKGISTFEFSDKAAKAKSEGKRVLYVAINKKLEGVIAMSADIDKNATDMIEGLKTKGIMGNLLTSDSKEIAAYYNKEFEIGKHMGDMLVRNKLDMLDELDSIGNTMVIANGVDNGELLGSAALGIVTGANYKEIIRESDCIVNEENKKDIPSLITAGKRYCTFMSSMVILSIATLLMCTFKMSGIEDLLGLKSMTMDDTVYGEWGICIAWVVAGTLAVLFALVVDMIKKKK